MIDWVEVLLWESKQVSNVVYTGRVDKLRKPVNLHIAFLNE